MEKYIWGIVAKFREFRTRELDRPARYLITKGITANHLTWLSFIAGILAVYFFFNNWRLLILFGLLHLAFDSIDGVVARLTTETTAEKSFTAGKYFDLTADSLPVILILMKIGWQFNDVFPYITAGLFTLSLFNFFISRLQAPFIPMRTPALLTAIISTAPVFSAPWLPLLVAAYLAAGICSVYALGRQLQWFVQMNFK